MSLALLESSLGDYGAAWEACPRVRRCSRGGTALENPFRMYGCRTRSRRSSPSVSWSKTEGILLAFEESRSEARSGLGAGHGEALPRASLRGARRSRRAHWCRSTIRSRRTNGSTSPSSGRALFWRWAASRGAPAGAPAPPVSRSTRPRASSSGWGRPCGRSARETSWDGSAVAAQQTAGELARRPNGGYRSSRRAASRTRRSPGHLCSSRCTRSKSTSHTPTRTSASTRARAARPALSHRSRRPQGLRVSVISRGRTHG